MTGFCILSLVENVVLSILFEWQIDVEICLVDNSMCNKIHRQLLLRMLTKNVLFQPCLKRISIETSLYYISWLVLREVYPSQLNFNCISPTNGVILTFHENFNLKQFNSLQVLRIVNGCSVDVALMQRFMFELISLTLHNCSVDDATFEMLCKTLTNIQTVELSDMPLLSDFTLHNILTQCHSTLTSVHLPNCSISDTALTSISNEVCTTLTDLSLSNCQLLTSVGVRIVSLKFTALTAVTLSHNCHITDSAVHAVLANLKYLMRLNVPHCGLLTDSALNLTHIHNYSTEDRNNNNNTHKMTELDVGSCRLMTSSVCLIIRDQYPCLTSLNITRCAFLRDTHLYQLLTPLSIITSLVVDQCTNLTDGGVLYIVQNCSLLSHLSMQGMGDGFTPLSVTHIVTHCSSRLRMLNLTGWCSSRQFTSHHIVQIARQCLSLVELTVSSHVLETQWREYLRREVCGVKIIEVLDLHHTRRCEEHTVRDSESISVTDDDHWITHNTDKSVFDTDVFFDSKDGGSGSGGGGGGFRHDEKTTGGRTTTTGVRCYQSICECGVLLCKKFKEMCAFCLWK